MGSYTDNLPKAMLSFNGSTLIEWQIKKLRSIGITDITIITGYKGEVINYPDITYFHNKNFSETNMVESLMCARKILNDDLLISYGDIIYTHELAIKTKESKVDIGITVDASWRDYWMARYGTTETDLETLSISADGKIVEIGKPVISSDGINYRYIGLLKFSKKGISEALEVYDKKKSKCIKIRI